MKSINNLSHDELLDTVTYFPETGLFVWKDGSPVKFTWSNGRKKFGIKKGCGRRFEYQWAFFYMTKRWPESVIDHINHDCSDNRWVNLRDVPHHINLRNTKQNSRNKSGHKGVSWCSELSKWTVRIQIDKCKSKNLGSYEQLEKAVLVRKEAERQYGYL